MYFPFPGTKPGKVYVDARSFWIYKPAYALRKEIGSSTNLCATKKY